MATKRQKANRERRKATAKDRREKHQTGFVRNTFKVPKGMQVWNPKKGPHRIDIVPFIAGKGNPVADEGMEYYERTYYVHRNVGPEGNAEICLSKTFKKSCAVCEHRTRLGNDPESDSEMVKALVPKERQLWYIIDHEERDKGVQLWDMSYHNFGKSLDEKIDEADPEDQPRYENFSDLEEGLTLRIVLSEKSFGGGKPFLEVSDIEFKERKKPLDVDIEELTALDDLLTPLTNAELKKRFLQLSDEEMEEEEDDDDSELEDEDELPKKKSKRRVDEDDDDDDDDDNEEEAPKKSKSASGGKHQKKTSGKTKTSSSDDEDEEEDDDEIPTTRGTKKKSSQGKGSRGVTSSDDDDDEDDDEEDSEMELLSVGDTVSFVHRKRKLTGEITVVNTKRNFYHIECDDGHDPHIVGFDDDTLKLLSKAKKSKVKPTIVDEDDEDDDEPPVKKKGKKTVVEDDDDDEDEDDDDDDEPPVKKKRRPVDEDPDWDDDDLPDDDDDDDEPPVKKKAKKK